MGNYLALCTAGDIQSKEALLKQKRVLQVIKVDGKVLEFTNPLIVRDLLVSYPNSYVGMFKEATQPLPLDHKLKIGKVYYLLPSLDHHHHHHHHTNEEDDARKREIDQTTMTKKTTIKVVITKEQLQQILSKQGRVEELILGSVSSTKVMMGSEGCSSSSCSSWFPKLESIPEGNDVVC